VNEYLILNCGHTTMVTKNKTSTGFSYPAVPIVQNDQRFFFTTIPVSALFPYCFVSRRNEDPKIGFQRRLNVGRAEDIAKYLNDGAGSIPTNIVLSAQEDSGIAYNNRSKILGYPGTPGSFLVLDGQHRLFGYHICFEKFKKDLRVPISVYVGLTRAEEARLFIDINTTQIGVPSALLLDIKQVAEIESTSEQVLRGLFDTLNSDDNSPLRKLLSPSKSIVGKISRVTFNKAMMPVIRANVWPNTSKKSQYQLLLNFLRAVSEVLDDRTVLTKSAFIESIFDIFDDVIQTSIAKHSNAKESSIKEVLQPLSSVDFLSISSKGKSTKATYLEAIKNALKKSVSISDSMV
jgi:DGQHR domain-containing protein